MDSRGKRRFYVAPEQVTNGEAFITGADMRHITQVMRYAKGDEIVLVDGAGFEFCGCIEQTTASEIRIRIIDKRPALTESPLHLTVVQAFLKERKMDDLLRPLTELGMTEWVPLMADRSVARPDARRLKRRYERWRTILKEGIKQCERGRVPKIGQLTDWKALVADAASHDVNLLFYERGGIPFGDIQKTVVKPVARVRLVLGPEGGFTQGEVAQAETAGFRIVSLGPRILRSETAAIAGASLAQLFFGDL
ncbi:MAG: rRNA methyltransferase [Deltaproteobacteria bacterium]|nr:MAG: rRNA methyltransferase [Deltaproteobacteria bacterium]